MFKMSVTTCIPVIIVLSTLTLRVHAFQSVQKSDDASGLNEIFDVKKSDGASDLNEKVALLAKQVTVLLDRRREDIQLLENNLKKNLDKSAEIVALKRQMAEMREQMKHLQNASTMIVMKQYEPEEEIYDERSSEKSKETPITTNDHLTITWLSSTVNELRQEFKEFQTTHNVSVMLQQKQHVETELSMLKVDVLNLNKELEGVRTDQLKYENTLSQLMEEVSSVKESQRSMTKVCEQVDTQIHEIQTQIEILQAFGMTSTKTRNIPRGFDRRSRHQRIMRKHLLTLERENRHITRQFTTLTNKIASLENQLSAVNDSAKQINIDDKINEKLEITDKISRLETSVDGWANKLEKCATTEQVKQEMEHVEEKVNQMRNQLERADDLKYETVERHEKSLEEQQEQIEKRVDDNLGKLGKLRKQIGLAIENLHKHNPKTIAETFEIDEETSIIEDNPVEKVKPEDLNHLQNHKPINLIEKIHKIESLQSKFKQSILNITHHISSFDSLHRSILELLESVEHLEDKVDRTVPDFRKAISQLEFNMAQTLSEIALMRDDQELTLQKAKMVNVEVMMMKERLDGDHETMEQLNITTSLLQASSNIQNTKLHDHILKTESASLPESYKTPNTTTIVEELEEIENAYHAIINKLPYDCTDIEGPNGLYLISPGPGEPIMVSCKDGWTTVQHRKDGTVEFNRNWEEYAKGFGTASGEFWIGNNILHRLTKDNCTKLHIDMIDIYNNAYHAEYDSFIVENHSNGYKLHVSGYTGNSSDALDYQNHMEFSTIDNDRDISNTHCASNYEGGWWFSHCQHANLNGKYNLGLTWFDSSRNEWIAVAFSEMTVKRKAGCVLEDGDH